MDDRAGPFDTVPANLSERSASHHEVGRILNSNAALVVDDSGAGGIVLVLRVVEKGTGSSSSPSR